MKYLVYKGLARTRSRGTRRRHVIAGKVSQIMHSCRSLSTSSTAHLLRFITAFPFFSDCTPSSARMRIGRVHEASRLGTLVVVSNADSTLTTKTLAPEAADLDVGLRDARVREEQPGAKDWLGEDVEDLLFT